MLFELIVNGLIVGAKLGMSSLGFAIIYYTSREFHLAYGALLTGAGYLGFVLISGMGLPVALSMLVVIAVATLVGTGIQRWVYRPLNDHFSVLMMALGLGIVLENALQIAFGADDRLLASELMGRQVIWGDLRFRYLEFLIVSSFLAVWGFLYYLLDRHRIGLALRAVMRDSGMSELVGIKSRHIRLLAYGLGSAIGAMSGLIMLYDSGLRPTAGFELLLFAFIATVLGMGSLHRVALWSVLIGVALNVFSWQFPTQFGTLFVFFLMLVYMLWASRSGLASQH